MTTSALIYLLFILAAVRLLVHYKPDFADSAVSLARIRDILDSVVWAGVVALLLIHFVVRSFYIPSGSMLPTLDINDYILVNQLIYQVTEPVRGDIVVFHPPPLYTGDKTDLIKRVVGLAHDKIEIKDGFLYLNDQPMKEDYLLEESDGAFGPEIVKEGHFFVMGDNRNNSRDSRYIGQIPRENLVGRAEMIFFPPRRIELFNVRFNVLF